MKPRLRQTAHHHRGEESGARAQIKHVERRRRAGARPVADCVESAFVEAVEAGNEIAAHGVVALRSDAEELAYRVAGTAHRMRCGARAVTGAARRRAARPLAFDLAADELLD